MFVLSEKAKKYALLMIVIVVVACAFFAFAYIDGRNKIEQVNENPTPMEQWTIENSALNGAPLEENKNIYLGDDVGTLHTIYITVFPTKSPEYGDINLSAFDLHENHNKAYNPILDANITFGDENSNLNSLINTDVINGVIRVRGNSARGENFKSYNIKITDEDSPGIYDMKTLNLNKHVKDKSKIANKFAFDMIKGVDDMASFRTNFVKVYMKDASLPQEEQEYEYLGLYTHVEQPNKAYLRAHGLDANGTIYKANLFEFRKTPALVNVDDASYNEEEFEKILGIREATDHAKILQMIEDVNNMNLDFDKVFHKYFNEENYLTWLATNILMGNGDIISHNFLLYSPSNSLTWYFLPWDYDKTFQFRTDKNRLNVPIEKGIQKYSGVLLHGRYLIMPGSIEKLNKKLDDLYATDFSESAVLGLIDKYKPVLEQTMTIAPDVGLLSFEPNELYDYLNQFPQYIKTNYDDYYETLQYPLPFFTSEPERLENGQVKFAWASSFDFQGDFLKYSIKVSTDYTGKDIVFQANDLISTEYIYEQNLPAGTYYLDIKCVDSNGNAQFSHDTFTRYSPDYFAYGLREFTIK